MQTHTTVRSWPAIALGTFFAVVTARVLFDDVHGGAAITTGHVLSLAALVAAIASGHMAWPTLRRGQVIPAALLAVLFLGSTGYVVVSSGARNAETAGTKVAKAEDTAKQRATIERMAREANTILDTCTAETPKQLHGTRCGLRDLMVKECSGGKGTRCDGKSYSVTTYTAALDGYAKQLAALGPATAPNGGYAHAAKVLAALVNGDADAIEAKLVLILPFVTVLISELGTITFLHLGFGHRRAPAKAPANEATFASKGPAPQPPKGGRKIKRIAPANVPANVVPFAGKREAIAALEKAGRPVSNRELANLMGVTDGEASKRVRELGDTVEVHRNGKALSISLRQRRAVA